MKIIPKPEVGEYKPYASMYIDLLPDDGLVMEHLVTNLQLVKEAVSGLTDEQLSTPHAEGEWTIKDILVHIIDDERIYGYRTLRFARNDSTELAGFEQDDYVPYAGANSRSLASILEEYESVRQASLTLFNNLPDEALLRGGVANGHFVTVRALAYHIAGHELHHLESIRTNYLT